MQEVSNLTTPTGPNVDTLAVTAVMREIANRQTEATARRHASKLRQRIGARTNSHLTVLAIKKGYLQI